MKIKYNERESLERELARYKGLKDIGVSVIPIYHYKDVKRVMKIMSIDEIIDSIELTLKGE